MGQGWFDLSSEPEDAFHDLIVAQYERFLRLHGKELGDYDGPWRDTQQPVLDAYKTR